MRAVVQRASSARVLVEGEVVGGIAHGLLVLLGVVEGDTDADLEWLSRKLVSLRIFPDDAGRMNRSVIEVGGSVLLVSQFTLCADLAKGTRPSFGRAMEPERAAAMFNRVVQRVSESVPVQTGRFGAHMQVELVNDGPVTLWLDSQKAS